MTARPCILIVDDHKDIRDPLAMYLSRFDFDVEAVGDGKAMRRRLEERSFSLIVLDIMLPGENGLSLCRYVSERFGIPVILLTAVAEQADRVAGLEIGADDYVVKPFDPRELVARIRSVVENANRVLTRDQLLDLTQKHDAITYDRSVDSQISRLRKKLEIDPRRPRLVKTIRGDGYMLAASVIRKDS
jgi:DNA-binding response OmpR family regulator